MTKQNQPHFGGKIIKIGDDLANLTLSEMAKLRDYLKLVYNLDITNVNNSTSNTHLHLHKDEEGGK